MKIKHAYFLTWSTAVILMIIVQMNYLRCANFFQQTYVYQRAASTTNTESNLQQANVKKTLTRNPYDVHVNIKTEKPPIEQQQATVPCKDIRAKHLQGHIKLSVNVTAEQLKNGDVLARVKPGGMFEPADCVADGGTAVIVPYRGREEHLESLVYHLHAVLQRQRLRYAIFVVEMAMPTQFNRGLLANAGFLTASTFNTYTCFIVHDVDLLPTDDRNLYTCGDDPRHLAVNSTKRPGGLPYKFYTGGVLAMAGYQYRAVNGFSNMFFGWGAEDDDMFKRIHLANLTLERPAPDIGSYVALSHKRDSMNPPNPHRNNLLKFSRYRMAVDGINSMRHQRKALEFRPYYTWMLVECIESAFFKDFPYIEADNKLMLPLPKVKDDGSPNPAHYKIIHHRISQPRVERDSPIQTDPPIERVSPKRGVQQLNAVQPIRGVSPIEGETPIQFENRVRQLRRAIIKKAYERRQATVKIVKHNTKGENKTSSAMTKR